MKIVRWFLACAAAFISVAVSAADAKWINFTANTPDTAYDWNDSSNWEKGYVGGTDAGDTVLIAPTAVVYIRVPDGGVAFNLMKWDANTAKAVLIGGDITICSANGVRAEWNSHAATYCTVRFSADNASQPYIPRGMFCGRVVNEYSNYIVGSSSTVTFSFDKYAEHAGETRTDDLDDIAKFGIGSTPLYFRAPVGADAASGVWKLSAGSPYAYRVSASAHPLAVGTPVTAEGYLPEGTFLKRVFDDGTVELSEKALAAGDATLAFAAFTPDFAATFPSVFYQHGAYMSLVALKSRAQDKARIDIGEYYIKGSGCTLWFGSASAADIPATVVLNKISGYGTFKHFDLRNAHLELAGDPETRVTEFSAARPWTMASALKARVTVTNGITGVVNALTNFNGTIVKDGGGRLKIGLGDAANAGSFTVEGGTLEIMRNATAGEGAALSIETLAISNGAAFMVPEGGISVGRLVVEAGATVGGGGTLFVRESEGVGSLSGVVCTGDAKIGFSRGSDAAEVQLEVPEAQVVGHPAFWVDASAVGTVLTNESGGVYRWNDCRAGEPMFCTNVASAYPKYVYGTRMDKRYVNLERITTATTLEETTMLVWSEPIEDIRAVFMVLDPSDGGGEILGRTSARLPWRDYFASQAGPYNRGPGNFANPLSSSTYVCPSVVNGRYYLDGVEVDPLTTGYKGRFLQLVEHHVNTDYDTRYGRHELVCDAFGTGYEQPHNDLKYKFGMRIAECIIYTNSLTKAERLKTAQYLMRKWFKRNVYFEVADADNTLDVSGAASVLDVAGGKALAVRRMGSGALSKTGEGVLFVDGCESASIEVLEGEAKVASGARSTEVPRDAWLHMDADDAETVVTYEGSDKLAYWSDVNGSGRTLRSIWHASGERYVKTYVETNQTNGRTFIDLGSLARRADATSDGLIMYREDGSLETTDVNGGFDYGYSPPIVQTMFFVYDSSPGGGTLFGGVGSDWPGKGLPRHCQADNDVPIFFAAEYLNHAKYDNATLSNALANGSAVFRRNGETINPFERKFLNGVEYASLQYDTGYREGRKGDTFGTYGNGYGMGDYCGGLKFGEIILFPRMLSADEVARVEAYLARKWAGVETQGYGAASADSLVVASGARLTVLGLPFETAELSGGGTVEGDVKVAEDGVLNVSVASDGKVGGLVVSGAVDFSDAGEVALGADSSSIEPGRYLLLSAGKIVPPAEWTVTGGKSTREYSVSTVGGSVYLVVSRPGSVIIVR